LLLGYAALEEREMSKAIDALKRAFAEVEQIGSDPRGRLLGSPKIRQSGSVDTTAE
jgi:hypothetical protein